jgi:xylulose-5-phosphate/fructose-6-phosphate phosphoketolase
MNTLPADDQIGAFGPARATIRNSVLGDDEVARLDAYWRATLYLSLGMIYLRENPLVREPLELRHTKRRLLGHWGTDPGLSLIYLHLNRLIKKYDLNMICIAGPGHGAPGIISNVYLEGTYSEIYPDKSEEIEGMRRLFRSFSFPGGIGSHCTPELPGSLHEGGELGYSLSHAYGTAFDHPDLITAVVVGDGESETGPLATAWHSNKFLNPKRDGAVLPILHLNGYKIDNPTVLARISHRELENLFLGYGYRPYFVEGSEPASMHQAIAATLEHAVLEIREIQDRAKKSDAVMRPIWPMIVLRSPKGWTCPAQIDGHKAEGSWRAHQVPIKDVQKNPEDLRLLEKWLHSYRPEELFDKSGRLIEKLRELPPEGVRRMSANPIANGGTVRKPLHLPDFRSYGIEVTTPGDMQKGNTGPLGEFLRDILRLNPTSFRVFGPDETASNKLQAVYEASLKTWMAEKFPEDDDGGFLGAEGRVMEMLSEHTLEGWLEGYLLSGRHGFLASYEAFVHVIDSMVNQHCKWLEVSCGLAWRAPISSLNLLITSTVWRQDHNGFTHQDPGFIDVVANKSARITRIYLPPDVNCLLSVADHCLRSVNYVNVIVSDKQLHLQYLDKEAAVRHCTCGAGIWEWASTDDGREPDVVFVGCGDIATQEALAATRLLREDFPDLAIRFVNVVDLFRLEPDTEHPHGFSDRDFDSLFTVDKPVIFNFHGYPWLIHKLTYRRNNHHNIHVRGYKEKGNINTPMELAIANQTDRFSLAIDAIDRVPKLREIGAHAKLRYRDRQLDCQSYAYQEGTDRDEIINWKWTDEPTSSGKSGG